MAKNALEVIAMAHRRLGLLSADEQVSADQSAFAGDVLEGMFAEIKEVQGMQFAWGINEVPLAAFLPLSYLLAAEIAPHYEVASEPRHRAMARLRAYAFPNDLPDSRDLDDDGVVTDEEADAAERALYY